MLRLVKRWGARLSALVAVGTLGVTPTAAQTLWRTRPAAEASPARSVCEVPGRLQEIKVELGWMADPSTCPCRLSATARGSRMIVRGEVPSEAVHQQTLRLAQLATSMPVVDAVRVHLGAKPAVLSPTRPDQLMAGVMRELREILGERARRVEVGMRAGGQVTLRGAVPSYEEKRAISSRIRAVSGCTCVLNELTVPPRMVEGRAVLPVSVDGSRVASVSGERIQPAGTPYRAARWSAPPPRAQSTRPVLPLATALTPEPAMPPRPLPTLTASVVPPPAPVAPVPKRLDLAKPANQVKASLVVPVSHVDGMPEPGAEGLDLPAAPPVAPPPPAPKRQPVKEAVRRLEAAPKVAPPPAPKPMALPSPSAPKAARRPAKPTAAFAQDRDTAGKKEREVTEIPPEDRNPPDLRWPMVVHSEGVPPPWKRSVSPSGSPARPLNVPMAEPLLPESSSDSTQVPESKPLPKAVERPPQTQHTIPMRKEVERSSQAHQAIPTPPVRLNTADRGVSRPTLLSSLFGKKEQPRPVSSTKRTSASMQLLSLQAESMRPQVKAAPAPKGSGSDRAYVTTGMVSFDEEPSESPAPSPPKSFAAPATPQLVAASPAELQQRVLHLCAGAIREVKVTIQPDRQWEVKVRVATREAANDVSMKILQQLPDMVQPHVHLKVEVTP